MALGRYGLVESAALRSRRAQRWVPIDVGNPTQGRLLGLELEALVGREVEDDCALPLALCAFGSAYALSLSHEIGVGGPTCGVPPGAAG